MCGGLWKISEYHKHYSCNGSVRNLRYNCNDSTRNLRYSTMLLFEIPERTYQTMHLRGQFALHSPQFVHLP